MASARCNRLFSDTRLLDMHGKHGRMDLALDVFQRMPQHDVVTWNALIAGYARHEAPSRALLMFLHMGQNGFLPDEATFVSVLKACARIGNLEYAYNLHSYMVKIAAHQDLALRNSLIDMYAKCGSTSDAYAVFAVMSHRNVISWTVIVSAYAKIGKGEEALCLFYKMKENDVVPDQITFLSALDACGAMADLEEGNRIYSYLLQSNIEQTTLLRNSLVDMYVKCGSIKHAEEAFNSITEKDIVSWTAMIMGCVKLECFARAFDLYERMRQQGIQPNEITFLTILNACAGLRELELGEETHLWILKAGIKQDLKMESALVDMYAKCGCMVNAQGIFDQIRHRDAVTWNALISGHIQHGTVQEAYTLLIRMAVENAELDEVALVNVISVCSRLAAYTRGKEIHALITGSEFMYDVYIGTALIDMYSKCGDLLNAREVFNAFQNKDVILWTALASGFSQHGMFEEAYHTMEQMQGAGLRLNEVCFLELLSACSHEGFVNEGCFLFSCMTQQYDIKPKLEHYTCIIDLLGRVGRIAAAMCVLTQMNHRPTTEALLAMLGSCRINGNVELAEHVSMCTFKLDPGNTSAFLLLANTYAAAEIWID